PGSRSAASRPAAEVPDGHDQRDPWSVITGVGRNRSQGKHAAGAKPRIDPSEPGPGASDPQSGPASPGPSSTRPGADPDAATAQLDTVGSGDAPTPPDGIPEQPDKKPSGKRQKKFWRELTIIVVAAAVLTLLVKAFVVQVYRIPSASMENTLLVGDRVLVNKLVYHFR